MTLNCPNCPDCTQPTPNKPWIFLGCCFKFDLKKTPTGFENGVNITTLLKLLQTNKDVLIWNYACQICSETGDSTACRTVVTMDICQLKYVLETKTLSDALNLVV